MGFQDKVNSALGNLFEEGDHTQHKDWRGENKQAVRDQNERKRSTAKGKKQQRARDAARNMDRPDTCPKCGKKPGNTSDGKGGTMSNMIFDHNKSWDDTTAGQWMCRQCHNDKDNLDKGEGGGHSQQSIRGNKPRKESFEQTYGVVFLEAEDEPHRPEPEDVKRTRKEKGKRFLPQTRKRGRIRARRSPKEYKYNVSENYPPLYFDAHWNRVDKRVDGGHTVHAHQLGIVTGKGGDYLRAQVTIDPRKAQYHAFSRPNSFEKGQVQYQEDAWIHPDTIRKRYGEIQAVIPKHPRETFARYQIDLEKGEMAPGKEPTGAIPVKPFTQADWRSMGSQGHGREAKAIVTPSAKQMPIDPQITRMSDADIEAFLTPQTMEVGPPEAVTGRAAAARRARMAAGFMKDFKDVFLHGDRRYQMHPDVERMINQGRFGPELQQYFADTTEGGLRRGTGRRDILQPGARAARTKITKQLKRIQSEMVSKFPSHTLQTKKGPKEYSVITDADGDIIKDRNGVAWGWPKGRPFTIEVGKLANTPDWKSKPRVFALNLKTNKEHEHDQVQKQIDFMHDYMRAPSGRKPRRPKFQPNPLNIIEITNLEGQDIDPDTGRYQIKITYTNLLTGEAKQTMVVDTDFAMYAVRPMNRKTQERKPKKQQRPKRMKQGPMESLARREMKFMDKLADLIDKPAETYSIDEISRGID